MQDYYVKEYGADSTFLPYGSILGDSPDKSVLEDYGLEDKGFHLIVARMEPENNTALLIKDYKRSGCKLPLIVVGGVPYQSEYADGIKAEADDRVKIIGAVFDSGKLNGLYRHCYTYLHGHEVGGTNPSLLRAMGAGAACIPLNVGFNTECVGEGVPSFSKEKGSLAGLLESLESKPDEVAGISEKCLNRSRSFYRWDAIGAGYARLFEAIYKYKNGEMSKSDLKTLRAYQPEEFTGHFEDWPEKES